MWGEQEFRSALADGLKLELAEAELLRIWGMLADKKEKDNVAKRVAALCAALPSMPWCAPLRTTSSSGIGRAQVRAAR